MITAIGWFTVVLCVAIIIGLIIRGKESVIAKVTVVVAGLLGLALATIIH